MSIEKPLVINVVGWKGSGKTTVANHLQRVYDFQVFSPRDTVQFAAAKPLDNFRGYAEQQHYLLRGLPNVFFNEIRSRSQEGPLCIDGLVLAAEAWRLQEVEDIDYCTLSVTCHDLFRMDRKRKEAFPHRGVTHVQEELLEEELVIETGGYGVNIAGVMAMHELSGWEFNNNAPRTVIARDIGQMVRPLLATSQQG
jgi:hypothetical protein